MIRDFEEYKKKPMTTDEYMAERCLKLEREIEELKEKIERLQDAKTFYWYFTVGDNLASKIPDSKILMSFEKDKLVIEEVKPDKIDV